MHNVSIDVSIDDSTAQVVGSGNVVVNSVSLPLRVFHRIGSSSLFGKVNNGIGLFLFDELHQQVVILGDIHVQKFNLLSTDFLPCLDTGLRKEKNAEKTKKKKENKNLELANTPYI